MNHDDPLRDALHAFFRIGAFIGAAGLLLALWQPPDSGEFVLSVCSAVMGGALMLGVALVTRFLQRRPPEDDQR